MASRKSHDTLMSLVADHKGQEAVEMMAQMAQKKLARSEIGWILDDVVMRAISFQQTDVVLGIPKSWMIDWKLESEFFRLVTPEHHALMHQALAGPSKMAEAVWRAAAFGGHQSLALVRSAVDQAAALRVWERALAVKPEEIVIEAASEMTDQEWDHFPGHGMTDWNAVVAQAFERYAAPAFRSGSMRVVRPGMMMTAVLDPRRIYGSSILAIDRMVDQLYRSGGKPSEEVQAFLCAAPDDLRPRFQMWLDRDALLGATQESGATAVADSRLKM